MHNEQERRNQINGVRVHRTQRDSALLKTAEEFKSELDRTMKFLGFIDIAHKFSKFAAPKRQQVVDINIGDPLNTSWQFILNSGGEPGLARRHYQSGGRYIQEQKLLHQEGFEQLLGELLLANPDWPQICEWINTQYPDLGFSLLPAPAKSPSVKVRQFEPPMTWKLSDYGKHQQRLVCYDLIRRTGTDFFQIPAFMKISATTDAKLLFDKLGNCIYIKPDKGFGGKAQYQANRQNQWICVKPSDTAAKAQLNKFRGNHYDTESSLDFNEFNKLLRSLSSPEHIAESAIPALRVDGHQFEFRFVFVPEVTGKELKLIGTCARRSGADSCWNNVSRGASSLESADAMMIINSALYPYCSPEEVRSISHACLTELCRRTENLMLGLYPAINGEWFNENPQFNTMAVSLDFLPSIDERNGQLHYYIVEVQSPTKDVSLGFEQFNAAGIARRGNFDLQQTIFGRNGSV